MPCHRVCVFVDHFVFFGVLMLVCDWVAGCLFPSDVGKYWLHSAVGIFLLAEQLCSIVDLVRFSLGSFLGILQCKVRCLVFMAWNSFGHQGMACGCSPPWFASLLVTLLCYLGAHYGFSLCRVGVGYALRVSPVVTRLTVYRRPQVKVYEFLIGEENNS